MRYRQWIGECCIELEGEAGDIIKILDFEDKGKIHTGIATGIANNGFEMENGIQNQEQTINLNTTHIRPFNNDELKKIEETLARSILNS